MNLLRKGLELTIILLFAAFLFTGCGRKEAEKKYKIGISQCSYDDWRKKMNEEIEREVMMHPDVEVEIRSADDRSEKQIEDIHYFLENDFDILVVAPNEADSITPIIKEVYDSGIPVLLFDRSIHGDSFTSWQGADNMEIGRAAARYASRLEHENPGNGKVLEIKGRPGSTPARERNAGFVEEISLHPEIRIAGSAIGNWNYKEAARVIDSLYNVHPDADIVYAHNDRMAIAASDVARKRGLHPHIIGVDAAPAIGIKAVTDTVIDATFLYPTEGHQLIRTALAILKNEPYERILKLPSASAVDKSNADILMLQNDALREETSKLRVLKEEIDQYWVKHSAQTTLFYASVAILILFAVLLFVILRLYWFNKRHQRQLEEHNRIVEEERDKQEFLNRELEKATQSKLVFFTNVSHDLRTPLTLIAEPVEQVRKASNLTEGQKDLMNIASKNIRILQRLINQILDFRKYENGKLDLRLAEVDFSTLLKEWADSFRMLARQQDIHFNVQAEPGEDYHLAIDAEKMERVFFNLVSNAFKHTPANGHIDVRCSCDGKVLRLSVADTGEGIPEKDLGRIFEQFFQVENVRPKGSGIGLALTKSFVELHGGQIEVKSKEGKGSEFIVTLPVSHVEKRSEAKTIYTEKDVLAEVAPVESHAPEFDSDKPMLLFIEDNEDMRNMVAQLMGEEYNVALAPNGKEGLRMAAKYVPDLIISDVMMPVMDGLECCRRIKEEVSTSHIPVLLLTACSMDEQKAEGYDSGADGYLAKPFSSEVLKARCRSLIANRKRIMNLWSPTSLADMKSGANACKDEKTGVESKDKKGKMDESAKPAERRREGAPIDNEFYNRFLAKVNEEMGNCDLNVDQLASELGLGRSQFYRKIKALTNYSPVELLRRLRLQKGREYLTTTEKSISEIAYEVGFSTPAYFTKCFRDAFGKTPTELREDLGR
ncbi:MAG: substrate-binding domain-containing protein [Muribaculaceae bacterium]|nr:substrate-binding domain-containing protein [Muribaculaceae bacterium]